MPLKIDPKWFEDRTISSPERPSFEHLDINSLDNSCNMSVDSIDSITAMNGSPEHTVEDEMKAIDEPEKPAESRWI